MTTELSTLETLCVNTIRGLAMDGPQKANSGHPGTAMALAPIGWSLYGRLMNFNPKNPKWPDRDRFILSCGHACILQYSCLHLAGFDLSRDDLIHFRQWHSKTPGHPESWITPGVETTTGPLGQGIANSVGFALAERFLGAHFNKPGHEIVNHYTYVIASDGDLMEGVSGEAASLAGHLKLGKIIAFYDDNKITIEGETHLAFSENVDARYSAYGWHVQRLEDANDLDAICKAVEAAKADPRPSLISVRTHIGYPSPNRQDSHKAHGEPLGLDEVAATKKILGIPNEEFYIPADIDSLRNGLIEKGAKNEKDWNDKFAAYEKAFPELAAQWKQWWSGELPSGWDAALKSFEPSEKGMATRESSGKVINQIAPHFPNWVGGSADLAPSTKTWMDNAGTQSAEEPSGRNFHFGIREHAMGSCLNGIALHGGLHCFGATFFIFSDYMRPAVRLASVMELPVTYVWTHDSIGLGEDGPTHQAVEHLASLRAMPHFTLIRPADANEVLEAWKAALTHKGPVGLVLSRQPVATLDRSKMGPATDLHKGGYILSEASGGQPKVILMGTGTEIGPCLAAQKILEAEGTPTRVVSMPCWAFFEAQTQEYRDSVLPRDVKARVAVEAGASLGWHRWIGEDGALVTMDRYGASAPWQTNMEKFGYTGENVANHARRIL